VIDKLVRILDEAVVTYFKVVSWNWLGGTEDKKENVRVLYLRTRDSSPGNPGYEAGEVSQSAAALYSFVFVVCLKTLSVSDCSVE
jgi:hypothetical protein